MCFILNASRFNLKISNNYILVEKDLTISLRFQFRDVSVILITWIPSSNETFKRSLFPLSHIGWFLSVVWLDLDGCSRQQLFWFLWLLSSALASVDGAICAAEGCGTGGNAYRKASWANLKIFAELWIWRWDADKMRSNCFKSPINNAKYIN